MHSRGRYGGRTFATAAFAATVIVAFGFEATPAAAQGLLSWLLGEQPRSEPVRVSEPRPRSHLRTERTAHYARASRTEVAHAARKTVAAEAAKPEPPPAALERPLFAVVSIADQHVSIYNQRGLVVQSAISSGMPGHSTPTGLFTIIGRERFHASNIYSGAPMPFMQRITWSGIAMHLGVVPGHPASHGCIRLPAGFAAKLWGMTRIGERVVISPQEVTPEEFAHPLLPAPKMRALVASDKSAPAPAAPQPAPVPAAEGPVVPAAQASAPAVQAQAQAPVAAVQPPLLNPHRYAEQLKVKAVAEAAALVKTVKERASLIGVKQQEALRAAAELRVSELALESARAKASAAASAYDAAAAAAASAKPQEAVLAAAEVKASESDAMGVAKTYGPTKASEAATAAKDAAAVAKTNADATLAAAAAKLEAAKTASLAKTEEAAEAVRRWNEATAASVAAVNAEKEAQRRMAPVSVLVSKKDRRIYVRQGLAPLFDAPASVRDPERPLGTHLFIATGANEDGASLKWSVLSMPVRGLEEQGEHRRKKASGEEEAAGLLSTPRWSTSSPAEALERVEIAPEIRDRIAELLWTGGSIIVSDQPPSGETGAVGTDLTVKLR